MRYLKIRPLHFAHRKTVENQPIGPRDCRVQLFYVHKWKIISENLADKLEPKVDVLSPANDTTAHTKTNRENKLPNHTQAEKSRGALSGHSICIAIIVINTIWCILFFRAAQSILHLKQCWNHRQNANIFGMEKAQPYFIRFGSLQWWWFDGNKSRTPKVVKHQIVFIVVGVVFFFFARLGSILHVKISHIVCFKWRNFAPGRRKKNPNTIHTDDDVHISNKVREKSTHLSIHPHTHTHHHKHVTIFIPLLDIFFSSQCHENIFEVHFAFRNCDRFLFTVCMRPREKKNFYVCIAEIEMRAKQFPYANVA